MSKSNPLRRWREELEDVVTLQQRIERDAYLAKRPARDLDDEQAWGY